MFGRMTTTEELEVEKLLLSGSLLFDSLVQTCALPSRRRVILFNTAGWSVHSTIDMLRLASIGLLLILGHLAGAPS
jgi:hypothetical protein